VGSNKHTFNRSQIWSTYVPVVQTELYAMEFQCIVQERYALQHIKLLFVIETRSCKLRSESSHAEYWSIVRRRFNKRSLKNIAQQKWNDFLWNRRRSQTSGSGSCG
jgi:hypothetical protein